MEREGLEPRIQPELVTAQQYPSGGGGHSGEQPRRERRLGNR